MKKQIFVFIILVLLTTLTLAVSLPTVTAITEAVPATSSWLTNPVTLDGEITAPEEWAETVAYDIPLLRVWGWPDRQVEPSDKVLTARFKNDATWLYMLYQIEWPAADTDSEDGGFIELFSGWTESGWTESDFSGLSVDGTTNDLYGWTGATWFADTDAGGQNNVEGAASHDGTSYWFEFRKTLDSSDSFDWSLTPGELVGSPNAPDEEPHLMVGIWDNSYPQTYEQYVSLQLGAKILVDASRDGGAWWYPQLVGEEDPDLPHQGKALADYLRSIGHFVDELPRDAITIDLDLLVQYDMVIAVAWFGTYSSDETEAYQSYVLLGGSLLLLTDHHGVDFCNLPLSFGLDYRGKSVGSNVVNSFVEHPITSGVTTLTYLVGSGLISYPPDANLIGWLSDDTFIDLNYNGEWEPDEPFGAPVLGYMYYGAGKMVFFGDVGTIEIIEQPFTENYLNWLLVPLVEDTEAYIEYANETIQDFPDDIFLKPEEDVSDVKNDFSDLFDDVLENIDEGNYEGAIEKLNRIKAKISEEMVESAEREEIIFLIDGLIAYLETLL